jgi:predicted nucleotide-binding protein (sugar kinase/HSP70/actin superfamily)
MVYLARKNGEVIRHTIPDLMREWDGVEPEMELTEEAFASHGNLARIIDGEIFLGKTDAEKAADSAKEEIKQIKADIAGRDYRVLKAQRLGKDVDELYPGETGWYRAALTTLGTLEETVRVIEPGFKA